MGFGWRIDVTAALADALGTIVGGVFLTVLYFVFSEKLFRVPRLAGTWILESAISQTKYNPFRGMVLRYKVLLFQTGNELRGTAEKVYEKSDKERVFSGLNRTVAIIEGTVQKAHVRRSTIFLHAVEEGEQRSSSWIIEARCRRFGSQMYLAGRFSGTAGDSSGIVVLERVPLPNRLNEYRGLPLGWFSRLIEAVTARGYRNEWSQLKAEIANLAIAAEEFWKTNNSHLLVAALVLAEDRRFYCHGGTDPIAICRALFRTVVENKLQGGSTIEQQLVRNLTSDYRKSLKRKLKEITLAARLHRLLQKDQIAVVYLISAYFGWHMNGVRQAAQRLSIDLKNPTVEGAAHLISRIRFPEPRRPTSKQSVLIAKRQDWIARELRSRMRLLY
jgi:hypothetical protein